MQKSSYRFILLFLFVLLLRVHADQISISPIPLIDQLPSNSVNRIFQDKEGFIWFGTLDGVCRYDAHRMLVFRSGLNNSNLLTNNKITCFAEDGNGHLLIGTQKGINILDKKTYRIKHWESEEIHEQWIQSMIVTSDGNIWIGTLTQVYRYNPDLSLRKQYGSSLPASSINSIFEDAAGDLWVALWRTGLYKYDAAADAFISFPAIGKTNNPFKIFQDNRKQHWIGTWGDGIYLFNPEKSGDEIYIRQELTGKERGSPEDTFFSIVQDDVNHYIWLMSISGLYALQYTEGGNLKEVDVSYLFEESNNIFSEIIKDKTGNLWIAAFSEGAFTINFDKPVIENYPIPSIKKITRITPNITAVFKDKDGIIWLNQNRWGLGWYDPRNNTIQFYNELPELRHFSDMGTVCFISDFRSIPDRIWVAPENESAIYCLKKAKGKIVLSERIDLMNCSETSGNPRLFYEDRKNNIWIATTTGLLVKRFDKDGIEPVGFSFGAITGITEDTRGGLWISSRNAGIYQISPVGDLLVKKYNKETSALTGNNITSICADLNGKVWIGTEEGNLIVYDAMEQTFQDVSQSFRMIGGGILDIVADDYGHIWVSTNQRITEYNPDNNSSRDYTVTDGVEVTSFSSNSYYKDKSGKLFFGGNKGISVFTPSNVLSGSPKNIKPIISDIKINYHSVFEGNNNCRFDIAEQVIRLEPEDKNIEIDFSSLDYTFSSKICYAYKMQGIDNDWVYAENNRQFAVYNQLKKGNYTFYIKATDENKLWSNEVTQLKIYKRPAYYETNRAYMLYATLAILFVYLTFRIIRNRIQLKHALQIAQIEKDKSEELTHIKLRYFTNISHDFLTPLTIISCLIDDVENTFKGTIKQFETIRSNINRLRRLLQQVLDFRKIESGNMHLKLSGGDIALFIKDVCYTNFLPLMKKKDIRFSFTSEPNRIPAHFDADKMDKIVFNLLSNAFKYTPSGGEVKMELWQYVQKQHTCLSVRISDTGIGIAKDDLEHIFTRFYTNRMGGAAETNGIGLSLVKELLDLHQGTIRVESEVNKGTVFTIDLPIDKESYSDSGTKDSEPFILSERSIGMTSQEESGSEATDDDPEKDNITLLLVEDNEDLRTVIQNILSKHYRVLTAQNGIEALSCIKENKIDIIVSDVTMPEIDGLELCRTLKKDLETSHIPVILLTARNSTDDRIECYNAGADGYISKPFDLKVLEARINNFITNKRSRQKEFREDVEINISTLEYPTLDEQFLNNAIRVIEEYLPETKFDVNLLAENLHMSKSSLYRKIKTMTGLSPIEFIRNIRLKHACRMLKDPAISISEVAYSLGFSDPHYFATCFKSEFNVTPSEYQRQSQDVRI